jgi:hypothetical protein
MRSVGHLHWGIFFVAQLAGLFATLSIEIRTLSEIKDLFMLGYSNANIGYLPDAFDINRGSYAVLQSSRFSGKCPFPADSGKGAGSWAR